MNRVMFVLAMMLSFSVFAQDGSLPECTNGIPGESEFCYYTQDCYRIEIAPSCGASKCSFLINVFKGKQQLFAVINDSRNVVVLDDQCIKLNETQDFSLISDLPKYAGPTMPLVLCRTSNAVDDNFVDKSEQFLVEMATERYSVETNRDPLSEEKLYFLVRDVSEEIARQYDLFNIHKLPKALVPIQMEVKERKKLRVLKHTIPK